MKRIFTFFSAIFLLNFSYAQVGIGTTTPGTALDVVGAITNRETSVAVSGNAVTIPANTSLVQITGTATGTITVNAPAAPNAGQRLIIYNNSTGGFGSLLNGITIPTGFAGEFIYSNSGWQSLLPIAVPQPSIIPYASSAPVVVTTLLSGFAGTGALVGFGNSISGISLSAGNIDATSGATNLNFGFTAPRNGTIKSISAFFSATASVNLLGNVTVKAQLYKSNSISSSIYSPVAGADVTLGTPLTGLISIGTTRNGIISGLNISTTAQDRYILVFSSTSNGIISTVTGFASAGVSVE